MPVNASCRCSRRISFRERDDLLNRGELLIIARQNANGHLVPDWRESVRMFEPETEFKASPLLHAPGYTPVGMRQIEKAYVRGNHGEQRRIEVYGELARDAGRVAWSQEVLSRQASSAE